jgi:hypothetical protein
LGPEKKPYVLLIAIGAILEIDAPIEWELCPLTQRIEEGKLGTQPHHVEDPTSHQHFVVPAHEH